MLINCDIGERGADHPQDRELMAYIHIANIACGGHAGDETSIEAFRALAEKHEVEVSAHLSYPDIVAILLSLGSNYSTAIKICQP